MPLELKQLCTKDEFTTLVEVEREAYSKPFNSGWEILKGPSLEECRERQWAWHTADPKSKWFYVADTEAGEVIGGAEWIVHRTDPFENSSPRSLKVTWWDDG